MSLYATTRAYPMISNPSATARRLPLRDELYLLAHDEPGNKPHPQPRLLAIGLAGATLIDLRATGQVTIDHDRIITTHHGPAIPTGDAVGDAALAAVRQFGPAPELKAWLHGFSTGLYERTRANLVAVGILRPVARRRLAGLVKADAYQTTHVGWAVRARARVTYAVTGREQPDSQCAALCGLATLLRLEPMLYLDLPDRQIRSRLRRIAADHQPPVLAITAAVDAAFGDAAVAVYR